MLIQDKVYGAEEIQEEVLIELINSKAMQRLKEISQLGLPKGYDHRPAISRFEHSIGVLILLRRLGADMEEQMAGLLHDISHTAFSHVVDCLFGDPTKEDYQDHMHKKILQNSDVPEILSKWGFEYEHISDIDSFSLLEKPMPYLCADRVDYTLRELKYLGEASLVKLCVDNLMNFNGNVVFKNLASAEAFANAYLKLQRGSWSEDESRARYYIMAQILKDALELKVISVENLMETDEFIINILEKSQHESIIEGLDLLKSGFYIEKNENGLELKYKFRYVDPEFLINNQVASLLGVSDEYKDELYKMQINKDKFVRVQIIKKEF